MQGMGAFSKTQRKKSFGCVLLAPCAGGDASGFLQSHLDVDFIYCYSFYGTPGKPQVHPLVQLLLNE